MNSIAADSGSSAKPNACQVRPVGSQSRNTRKGCSPKCSMPNVVNVMAQPNTHARPMPPSASPALSFLLRCAHNTMSANAASGRKGRTGVRLKMAGKEDACSLIGYPFIMSISSTFTVLRWR